ncbi:MAG: 3-oxoacyl-ACP reductase family protein [Candidatus Binatus sp.]|uniref:SDR family NAD(P)-dependent oxidoreductase n=1 Tax=Candidatus Binatus sp. TaxID=2811406 RepID=UPI003D0BD001
MDRLTGKVAIVTGAANGIGRAIAIRLADEGAKVALADIQFDSAEQAAAAIRRGGGVAIAVALDVTKLDEAIAAADRVESELGPIDIMVNNAGWDVVGPFVESAPDVWDKVIAINFRGVLNCCKAVAPRMQSRGAGKIVSISSDAARVGSTGEAVYAGCKAAIIGFSKTLARELAANHINVNVVCPGPTDTALLKNAMAGREKVLESMARGIPFRRLGQPADLAGAVAFFASADSDFVTGQVLSVSGGLTMAG